MPQPPALKWVLPFCNSLSGALGQSITATISETVNPLIWRVAFQWAEPMPGKLRLSLWNLIQQWTSKNECLVTAKSHPNPFSFVINVGVKSRGWKAKDKHPLD